MLLPYYERDGIALYCGDSLALLPQIPRDSAELVIADPPYGVQYQSGRGRFEPIAGDDGTLDVAAILTETLPILRPNRHLYVFGPSVFEAMPGIGGRTQLVWDKRLLGMGDLATPWAPSHEPIWFGVNRRPGQEIGAGNLAARVRRGSVLRVQRQTGGAVERHPTEKPVELLRLLIESSTCLGERVLDPFAGSGATLVAALVEGRRALGIEIDVNHCETAARWLESVRAASY